MSDEPKWRQIAAQPVVYQLRLKGHLGSRWVNIVAGFVIIAYIWGGAAAYPHYIFIAIVETVFLLLVIWIAWTWRSAEA